jgi:hypothetical protein
VRLAQEKLREPDVKTVSHYGLTLDEKAAPQEVAFAALQAIKADWGAKSDQEREAALDVQFELAAGNEIVKRNRTAFSEREFLYQVVSHWTPTVSYYVDDFPQTLEEASKRLVPRSVAEDEAELAMTVNAPGNPPEAQVVMLIWLAKDRGMWRVLHFGFDNKSRTLGRAPGLGSPNITNKSQGG